MFRIITAGAFCAAIAAPALAQTNLEKLGAFKVTGTKDHTYVDQKAPEAESIREGITLPDGFKIELYALVPDARHMAMAPQGTVLFVGTKKNKVWAVMDRNRDRVADEVKDFAPSLEFDVLLFLAARPGRVYSRDALMQQVWGEDRWVDARSIDSVVSRLRRKLEPDPRHPRYVQTVWGAGYRFAEEA